VSRPTWLHRATLVSVVATGRSDLLQCNDRELIRLTLDDLAAAYPSSPAIRLLDGRVVRQPRAFLTLSPGARTVRPLHRSPIRNLLIGGDWTDTGLPPILEGAILRSRRCAEAVIAEDPKASEEGLPPR
jgi:uncharacterized protein with NAD-binding domain and iron-sulfur cluster